MQQSQESMSLHCGRSEIMFWISEIPDEAARRTHERDLLCGEKRKHFTKRTARESVHLAESTTIKSIDNRLVTAGRRNEQCIQCVDELGA